VDSRRIDVREPLAWSGKARRLSAFLNQVFRRAHEPGEDLDLFCLYQFTSTTGWKL